MCREIAAAYRALETKCGAGVAVAVRSSATAEDLPTASFAGQHESFLNVRGEADVIEACRWCFASIFTDRAIVYRVDNGFDHFKVALSVGVMKMVRADLAASGVIFTLDTESGFRDVVFITGAWGLGENIVRGEGEITFRELLRALETQRGYDRIAGLSYRTADGFCHNPARGVSGLEDGEIRPPRRDARVLKGYTLLGRQVDVIETSRGCTFDCSFCSIIEMRGRNFHTYSFERVLADIRDARDRGARSLFIVDDNITLNVRRFEALCRAIIDAGLNELEYTVQATTSAIASHGERLARLMREAGFRYVFLGIENILEEDLRFLRAESKNRERENGRKSGNATLKAIDHLHRNKMIVVGGLIVGSPGDTREAVETNLEFARRYVDWPYIQHPTPYPGTPMTKDFRDRGLIINDRLEEYDGTTAVVRTEHLSADEVEFLRWRAERWMKLRHMPAAFADNPLFLLRNAPKMFAHTFRGSTIRSFLGLEDERKAFQRFQAIRRAERGYV